MSNLRHFLTIVALVLLVVIISPSHALLHISHVTHATHRVRSYTRSMMMRNKEPKSPKNIVKQEFVRSSVFLIGGTSILSGKVGAVLASGTATKYPIVGADSLMNKKAHGTGGAPVQFNLRWNCDPKLADRICNFNRQWAEFAGYWTRDTSFLQETSENNGLIVFYDSITGKPLFKAPVGRSFEDWKAESMVHGWPSFRDDEVEWRNVRALRDGEMVSVTGTHLGHNLVSPIIL